MGESSRNFSSDVADQPRPQDEPKDIGLGPESPSEYQAGPNNEPSQSQPQSDPDSDTSAPPETQGNGSSTMPPPSAEAAPSAPPPSADASSDESGDPAPESAGSDDRPDSDGTDGSATPVEASGGTEQSGAGQPAAGPDATSTPPAQSAPPQDAPQPEPTPTPTETTAQEPSPQQTAGESADTSGPGEPQPAAEQPADEADEQPAAPRGFRPIGTRILGTNLGDLVAPVLGLAVLDAIQADAGASADAGQDGVSGQAQGSVDVDDAETAKGYDQSQSGGAPMTTVNDLVDNGTPLLPGTPLLQDVAGNDSIPGHVASLLDTTIDTVASVSNNVVDGLGAIDVIADRAGDPVATVVDAATGAAEAAGVGDLAGSNLLSAIADTPSAVLDGRGNEAIHDIFVEAESAVTAAGVAANQIVDAINPLTDNLVQQAATTVSGVLGSDILDGGLLGDGVLGSDILDGGVLGNGALGGLLDNVTTGPLLDGSVLDLDGNGPAGTLIGAVLSPDSGALLQLDVAGDGTPSQSGNLIDIGLGPNDQQQGGINLLDPTPGGNDGALYVNALGNSGLRLLDADLGTDPDALDFAGLSPLGSGTAVDGLLPGLTQSSPLVRADLGGDGTDSQSSNLIDIGAGPSDQHQGAIDVLNPTAGGNPGMVEVNALDTGADGPRLVDGDLLTAEDGFDFGALGTLATVSSVAEPLTSNETGTIVPSPDAGDLTGAVPLIEELAPTIGVLHAPLDLNI